MGPGGHWEGKFRHMRRPGFRRPKYNIPVNIIEHADAYEVRVHALTYPKDRIKVAVVDDILYISGTRDPQDASPNFVLQEYPIKSFERSFELSPTVDKENIKASVEDGVLVVRVPKTEAFIQPEIEIDVE